VSEANLACGWGPDGSADGAGESRDSPVYSTLYNPHCVAQLMLAQDPSALARPTG
jgi:hypothetical protein